VLAEKGEKEVKMIPTTSRTRWTKKTLVFEKMNSVTFGTSG